jgi:uncharacterized protein
MPEVIFPGPDGRLEGRYHPQKNKDAPVAIILHPHPLYGGTMNNKVVYNLHYAFYQIGFTCLRFNFRGVGRSQGEYDHGIGELSDAAAALDYLQALNPNAKVCWVAGFSFGAWIAMQLLMRRPEIQGFVAVAPPANQYDFSFLAPCPSSGLIISGEADRVVPPARRRRSRRQAQAAEGHHDHPRDHPGRGSLLRPGHGRDDREGGQLCPPAPHREGSLNAPSGRLAAGAIVEVRRTALAGDKGSLALQRVLHVAPGALGLAFGLVGLALGFGLACRP